MHHCRHPISERIAALLASFDDLGFSVLACSVGRKNAQNNNSFLVPPSPKHLKLTSDWDSLPHHAEQKEENTIMQLFSFEIKLFNMRFCFPRHCTTWPVLTLGNQHGLFYYPNNNNVIILILLTVNNLDNYYYLDNTNSQKCYWFCKEVQMHKSTWWHTTGSLPDQEN